MILVTGATGNVGRHVVSDLLAAGEKVRAVSRRPGHGLPPGVDVVRGDLSDPATLRAALRDADRAYFFPVPGQEGGFLDAATESGLDRIVLLSAAAVTDPHGGVIRQRHAAFEHAVAASGLSWTFLRPGPFMVNDLRWAPGIKATGVVRAPFARAASAPIDERDIAAVAVRALLEDGHAGQAYELTGPQSLTPPERVAVLGQVLGHDLHFEEVTAEQAREQMASHMPAAVVDAWMALFAAMTGTTPAISPAVRELTGRAPHTYADWAALHAGDFR